MARPGWLALVWWPRWREIRPDAGGRLDVAWGWDGMGTQIGLTDRLAAAELLDGALARLCCVEGPSLSR